MLFKILVTEKWLKNCVVKEKSELFFYKNISEDLALLETVVSLNCNHDVYSCLFSELRFDFGQNQCSYLLSMLRIKKRSLSEGNNV